MFDDIKRFFNTKRRHSTIGYLRPMAFEMRPGSLNSESLTRVAAQTSRRNRAQNGLPARILSPGNPVASVPPGEAQELQVASLFGNGFEIAKIDLQILER